MNLSEARKLLNVDKNATEEEISKSRRRLAMLHHPDRGGDVKTLADINAAHDFLLKRIKENDEGFEDQDCADNSGAVTDAILRASDIFSSRDHLDEFPRPYSLKDAFDIQASKVKSFFDRTSVFTYPIDSIAKERYVAPCIFTFFAVTGWNDLPESFSIVEKGAVSVGAVSGSSLLFATIGSKAFRPVLGIGVTSAMMAVNAGAKLIYAAARLPKIDNIVDTSIILGIGGASFFAPDTINSASGTYSILTNAGQNPGYVVSRAATAVKDNGVFQKATVGLATVGGGIVGMFMTANAFFNETHNVSQSAFVSVVGHQPPQKSYLWDLGQKITAVVKPAFEKF